MPLPHNLYDYCSIRISSLVEKYLVVKRKISFVDKADILLTKLIIRGGVAVAGQQLDLLNHSALAEVFVKQENGEETLPSVFAIMPDKYQRLSMSKAECQQDVDGRAAIRLRKQMKYYE